MISRPNAHKTEISEPELPIDLEELDLPVVEATEPLSESGEDIPDIDEILNSLKALLNTVEKLQKIRQDVTDILPMLLKMLDGELVSGEELEQLKTGVGVFSG